MRDKNPQSNSGIGKNWKRYPTKKEIFESLTDEETVDKRQAELLLKLYQQNKSS